MLLLGHCHAVFAAEPPGVLTTTAGIRGLSAAEAEKHHAVLLRGTVLYCDPIDGHAFLHDATGSIYFRPGRIGDEGAVLPAVGDLVEIRGVTVGGKFSPSVAGFGSPASPDTRDPSVRPVLMTRLGKAVLPAPVPTTADRVTTGEFHDQYVELQGTIRSVDASDSPVGKRIGFSASSRFGHPGLTLLIPASATVPDHWENVPATFRGIASGGSSTRDDVGSVRLLIPNIEHIQPHFDRLEAAFSGQPKPFHRLFSYTHPGTSTRQLRHTLVEGTITHTIPGKGLYLNSTDPSVSRGLYIQTPQEHAFAPGNRIRAVGFPTKSENLSFLGDGILRLKESSSPPVAIPVTPEQALSGDHHAALVSLEGRFVEEFHQGNLRLITLQTAGPLLAVRVPLKGSAAVPEFTPGAWLQATGILDPENHLARSPGGAPIQLHARSPADIRILRQPPWFTTRKLAWIIAGLVSAVVLGSVWISLLRWQVSRQSRSLAEKAASQTLVEERQRIARELHDTLEQQLAGIQFHLDAVADWTAESPALIKDAVGSARAMLAHSRSESRQSILQLRSPALENLGLLGAIRHDTGLLTPSGKPAIHIASSGDPTHWPGPVEFHILRIVHEVITNSVKHADCDDVFLNLAYHPRRLEIEIRDNGSGFDQSRISGDSPGFGLLGIRERILKIRATHEIHSAPGTGTTIQISIPKPGHT